MRRNTLLPQNIKLSSFKNRRHRTLIQNNQQFSFKNYQQQAIKYHFMNSQFIVRSFIDNILINNVQDEISQIQLKKIVNQTMKQCQSMFHNQNWQIDPKGPFKQTTYQNIIKLDQQPQIRHYDPKLGFSKPKIYKQQRILTQSSISLSRFKSLTHKNINAHLAAHKKQQKSSFLVKSQSKNSIRISQQINFSKDNLNFPKLIPLKIDHTNTSDSTRRTLQDFLRQKKINAQINLGYKIKYIADDKQNFKTTQQFPKSTFFLMNSKNQTATAQNSTKLPILTQREDFSTDYNGEGIMLKKQPRLKKTAQILKTICKLKAPIQQKIKIKNNEKIQIQKIKLRPSTLRDQSVNLTSFSARLNSQIDVKNLLQQNLYTNRARFRQINNVGGLNSQQLNKQVNAE